jgi:uncharacterized membrane protein
MQYGIMILSLFGVLLSASRARTRALLLVASATFTASALIALLSGHPLGHAMEIAAVLTSALLAARYLSRALASRETEIAPRQMVRDRENFSRRLRMLGLYVGEVGAAHPGSSEELKKMELGPISGLRNG